MEKTLTNKIINKLNKDKHIWVRKRYNSGMTGTKGWPDVTGVIKFPINGHHVGIRVEIEVKQPGKKPTTNQYSRLRKFRKLGCIAFWTDDFETCMQQFHFWCNSYGLLSNTVMTDLLPGGKKTVILDL
jgi:hypothetical protein